MPFHRRKGQRATIAVGVCLILWTRGSSKTSYYQGGTKFHSNEIVYISIFCAPPFVWFCFVESPHFTHWIDQNFRSTISVISGHAHEIQQRKGFEPLAHPWLGRQDSAADRRIAACQSVKGRAATVVVGSNVDICWNKWCNLDDH